MDFALETAFKAVIIGLIVAICLGLMFAVGSVVVEIFNEIDLAVDGAISDALTQGRQLANIFINPHVFNACVALWITSFPLAIGYTFGLYINKLLHM